MSDERHQVLAVNDHLDEPASVPALSYDFDGGVMMMRRRRKMMRGDLTDERNQVLLLAVDDHLDVPASVPALSHDGDDDDEDRIRRVTRRGDITDERHQVIADCGNSSRSS